MKLNVFDLFDHLFIILTAFYLRFYIVLNTFAIIYYALKLQ